MKKLAALFFAILISASFFAGCTKKDASDTSSFSPKISSKSAESTAEISPDPSSGSSETEDTADSSSSDITSSTSDPGSDRSAKNSEYKAEAQKLADQHGLTEEDLSGEYYYFVKFSEAIESNPNLGKFREFMYLIYPVIADMADYVCEETFMPDLQALSITFDSETTGAGAAGKYIEPHNVYLQESLRNEEIDTLPQVLFHELMHFLDYRLNGGKDLVYILDGKHYHPVDTNNFSLDELHRMILCEDSTILTEGGAEYFTAKYLSGEADAYWDSVSFLVAIEYIMGEEYLNDLFFSWDSDAKLEELFLDAGYTEEQYKNAIATLNNETRPLYCEAPENPDSIDDILIDLYTYYKGENWKEDKNFLMILRDIQNFSPDRWDRSKYADFLYTIKIRSFNECQAFSQELLSDIPEKVTLTKFSLTLFLRDGKFVRGGIATMIDPNTGDTVPCFITLYMDNETNARTGYEIRRIDEIMQKCFPDGV